MSRTPSTGPPLALDLTPDFPENTFPRDGGFGSTPGDPVVGFGNGTFNTPPLVEAADTGPFFHDNQLTTIEGAVAFYNSDAFANSAAGGGQGVGLQATEIEEVGAFLRAINALENVRQTRELLVAVQGLAPQQRVMFGPPLMAQAAAELDDAIRVLAQADLQPDAVPDLAAARARIPAAPHGVDMHPASIAVTIGLLDSARAQIVM